jgi:putative tricarboxylic transport membrane protein
LLISFGLIALGSFVVYGTQSIAETQGYAQIGPRLFPYLIGVGMTLCGTVLGWQALAGGWRNVPLDQGGHAAPDWLAFAVISAGIVLHMVVIGWAGFIIASILLFVMVARGFGSRRAVRDAILAVMLAVVVFVIFTVGLGLSLPRGPFGTA